MAFASRLIAKTALAGLAAGLLATSALAQQARPQQSAANQPRAAQPAIPAQTPAQYPNALPTEAVNRHACEAVADRIFVQYDQGSECIAYYATPQQARPGIAVFYFEGDVPAADLLKPNFAQNYLNDVRTVFPRLAAQHGVRFVFVSRPGVFVSSGNHGNRLL